MDRNSREYELCVCKHITRGAVEDFVKENGKNMLIQSSIQRLQHRVESRLLATRITDNPNFTQACESGDGLMIMEIVDEAASANK